MTPKAHARWKMSASRPAVCTSSVSDTQNTGTSHDLGPSKAQAVAAPAAEGFQSMVAAAWQPAICTRLCSNTHTISSSRGLGPSMAPTTQCVALQTFKEQLSRSAACQPI